jgi:hypothetical protein
MIKTEFLNIYEELNALNEDLNKFTYYHGTRYKKDADGMPKNGRNASLAEITNGGQGDMQSISGVSYLAKDK